MREPFCGSLFYAKMPDVLTKIIENRRSLCYNSGKRSFGLF